MPKVEYTMIPTLRKAVLSHLSSRNVASLTNTMFIHWIHFDTIADFIKALQGYGTIELDRPGLWDVDEPCRWTDGPTTTTPTSWRNPAQC